MGELAARLQGFLQKLSNCLVAGPESVLMPNILDRRDFVGGEQDTDLLINFFTHDEGYSRISGKEQNSCCQNIGYVVC